MEARIIEEEFKSNDGVQYFRYFDKEGNELHSGDIVRFASGRWECLYLTDGGELGVDATNRKWIEMGRAVPCEYGIYPLTYDDVKEIVKIS